MVEIVRVKPGESGYEAIMEAKVKKKVKGGGSLNEAALAKRREYAREYYRRKRACGVKKTGLLKKRGPGELARVIEKLRAERDGLDIAIATLERLSAK